MLKCITKCSKGFDRCCYNCELKALCKDACPKDPKGCEYHVDSEEERAKIRVTTGQKITGLCIIGLVAFLVLLFTLMVVIGNQNSIMTMQTDTLDQIMELRQEQEVSWFDKDIDLDFYDDIVTPPDQIVTYQLTPEERDLVERVTAAEARSEDLQGQMAVAQVILDRSVLWDMPVADVVLADGQFADPYQGKISDEIHLAVANVFDGGVRVFEEPVTHFYDDSISAPYWTEGKANRGSIGRMIFWGD